ncbi:MAG TPA: tRNA (adenosine(37)-N6)-threonylcarbamoyltransferase complex transferase subunit TsaD [Candidatus Paceibacterota bacterium]|nr:tRNA (adenosine(37)-N6)-threonylcarbamoyltransferase complex transferase subunit TsaD [Candidatus Paceibacterota bacterium]
MKKIVLGIETSCDETAVCIAQSDKNSFKILSSVVSSQIKVHAPFGGVVPSLAKREHQKNLIPVLKLALKEAGLLKTQNSKTEITKKNKNSKIETLNEILEREDVLKKNTINFLTKYSKPKIDSIAVTYGPGLAPALWPGINLARALSFYWDTPLIPINHLEAHILANWITDEKHAKKLFPAICAVISGGHTLIVLMKKIGQYKIIGETRDDAAGECFDKSARLLGLGYPGGPAISQFASTFNPLHSIFKLPRPMINTKDFDFSFSGLKTAVLYLVQDLKKQGKNIKELTPALCYEIQEAINETLVKKTISAAKKYKARSIILGGGVVTNQALKDKFIQIIKKENIKINFMAPERKLTTDNAAMIAIVAHLNKKIIHPRRTRLGREKINWENLQADANLKF